MRAGPLIGTCDCGGASDPPDGAIRGKLPENEPGILISDIDLSRKYYDASGPFRQDAINGRLNSGKTVKDKLSDDRTGY